MPRAPATPKKVKRAPWLRRYRHLLGRLSDGQIARKVGVTSTAVGNMRRRLGIPAAGGYILGYDWPERIIRRLGTVPDRELAAMLFT